MEDVSKIFERLDKATQQAVYTLMVNLLLDQESDKARSGKVLQFPLASHDKGTIKALDRHD